MKIDRTRPTPKSFWSYKAPPPPDDPPAGVRATRAQWMQLTPGFRREIARTLKKLRRDMSLNAEIKAPALL